MRLFRKKSPQGIEQAGFSQADITDGFGDNLRLAPDKWVATIPLNKNVPEPQRRGLPAIKATADDVYQIASRMSEARESLPLPNDGVYCPVCHIANNQLSRLRTPCPKCGRPLLKFGWD